MTDIVTWRKRLIWPGAIRVGLGAVGVVLSFVLLATISSRVSIERFGTIAGSFEIVLIAAMLATALGSDALLVRFYLPRWATTPNPRRIFWVIVTVLLIVVIQAISAFVIGGVFTIADINSSCGRYEC